MPAPAPDEYYIRLAYRFACGETLDEIANDVGKARTTIRDNVKRGVERAFAPYGSGLYGEHGLHLRGFDDWKQLEKPVRPNFRFIREHTGDICSLIEGDAETTIDKSYDFIELTGRINDDHTLSRINKRAKKGWTVVDRSKREKGISNRTYYSILMRRERQDTLSVKPALEELK